MLAFHAETEMCLCADLQAQAAATGMGSAAVLSRALGPQLMAQALGWKRSLPGNANVQNQLWCHMQV